MNATAHATENNDKDEERFFQMLEKMLTFETTLDFGGSKALMNEIGAKSRDLYQVPIAYIKELPDFNVRVHDEAYDQHIDFLAESIRLNGFYQDKPLAGYVASVGGKNVIYLTDGYSRFKGVKRAIERGANITTLPMVFKPASTSLEDLTVALVTSNEGKPLTPFEKGIVCKRLEGYGMEIDEIASRLKISALYVGQLLRLMGLPSKIRKMVQEGKLSAENALAAQKKHGDQAVSVLETASALAKASGKTRVTGKNLPGAQLDKVVKKQAPAMADTLRSVKADPGYTALAPEIRERLESLLTAIDAAEGPSRDEQKDAAESATTAGEAPAA
ncbi:hypothetical protein QZM25_32740 [Burkholderia contaminans]|uniref:ParB/RepB/Spo0J family partition protein n=1 Tax=Burkholderia cepacia complex TaxID=87882 RepID=UPI001F4A46CE|nr:MULTISPECIES: hypothetical protein [Burkholderia cepacia complex]MDN7577383.1 hypothetical protein [Burkholderia contaminans]MDN7670772.1 hypothetical protein [Burkholderia vietnamiensis]